MAAIDCFLKIDTIKGESKDDKHPKEIDVLSWSWGASNGSGGHLGGGMGAGKVSVQDITVTKYVDVGSPDLFLACCDGSHKPKAVLTCRKAGGKAPLEYLKITMEEVFITSVSLGGSNGEDRFTENISLSFDKVKIEYTEQTAEGGTGDQTKSGWNISKNVKA